MPVRHVFGNTYGFGFVDDEQCIVYDNRKFCQKIQQSDQCAFEFAGEIIGTNLVVCGDFGSYACTLANWKSNSTGSPYAGWTWGGQMQHIVGMTTPLYQNNILTSGKLYKVTFDVFRSNPFNEVTGSVGIALGTNGGGNVTASGTYVQYILASDHYLVVGASIDFDGYVDNFIIQEVCSDYRVGLIDNTTGLMAGNTLTPAAVVAFEVYNGMFIVNSPFSAFNAPDGCYSLCLYSGCDSGSFINIVKNGDFLYGGEWDLGGAWTIGSGVASYNATPTDTISQIIPTIAGKKYTIKIDMVTKVQGSVNIFLGGTLVGNVSSVGTSIFTGVVADGDSDNISITTVGKSNLSIDNVVVILEEDFSNADSCSQCLDLRTSHPCTRNIQWTNDDNAFGFQYIFNVPSGVFIQGIRVDALITNPNYLEQQSRFRNSIGTDEILKFDGDKKKDLVFSELPEYLHDAISIGKGHDHFYVDSTEFVADEGYKIDEDKKNLVKLWGVSFLIRKKTVFEQNKKV